jgi:hypothetical protein
MFHGYNEIMRAKDLVQRLEDHPFQPFRVHLLDGTILPIKDPVMIIVSDTTAIIPNEFGRDVDGTRIARRWRTVDLLHIFQFSEADERLNGRSRRRRR